MTDTLLFAVFPYVALFVFLIGTLYRYHYTPFKYSSLSSEFLEGKKLFWASVPFHYGIMFLFFGHLVGLLFPAGVLAWNSQPVRLLILEITAFAFGLSVFWGLIALIYRRVTNPRIRIVTSKMDVFILLVLLFQVGTGLWIAYFARWGSSWFASVMAPYLKSVFVFNPQIAAVSNVNSLALKLHILGSFFMVGIIPFTRLVHFLVPPLPYLWRPFQKVLWYWDRRRVRNPDARIPKVPPRNN